MNELLYTVTDVARLLNVCEKTILNWHKSGKLVPSTITPRGWRLYRQAEIDAIDNKKQKENTPC
jgi:DNA-binding transcriptional MerR regulator